MMHKLLSIGISFLVLCQSAHIQLDDIIQLDDLIEHARFHKKQYGDSFFVFLSKHYGEQKIEHSKKHQEEKNDHERLPFQNHLHFWVSSTFMLKQQVFELDIIAQDISLEKADNFYYQVPYTSLYKSGVFQPPRNT